MTRAERTYYLISALYNGSWAFLGAVYPLFLMSRGLNLFEVNAILAVFLFANFAFEVPTGAVADVFGRKVSFLLSCIVRAFAFACYFFADTFTGFVVAELIDALGNTLASGALDAWAVDGAREEGDESPADRLFARGKMVSYAAMIASGLLGGYVAEVDISYPWLAGVGSFLVTAVVAGWAMHRDAPQAVRTEAAARVNPIPAIRAQVASSVAAVAKHETLRFLCCFTALLSFAHMPFLQLWPARMTALSQEGTWLMGWIWVLLNLAALVGSGLLPRLLLRTDRQRAALLVTVVRASCVSLAAVSGGFGKAAVGLIGQSVGAGASDPLLGAWMNEYAESHQRATVLSVQAMSFTLGGAAGLVCLGLVALSAGIPVAWGCAAAVLFAAVVVVWRAAGDRQATAAEVLVPE